MRREDNHRNFRVTHRNVQPLSLAGIQTSRYSERRHLVRANDFATAPVPEDGVAAFIDSLPRLLAGQALRTLVAHIVRARRQDRDVVAAMGAHVVKCGLSPVVIDLMRRGIVTAIALNGAGAIHDYEIALGGRTSEDVVAGLEDGSYGTSRETANAIAAAAQRSSHEGCGLGCALGQRIIETGCPNRHLSLLATAAELGVVATVHVAFGTDTVHMHPVCPAADLGKSTHIDFRIACAVVAGLAGGVWLNIGSAVVLPEVFIKAVAAARNLGHVHDGLVTANLDMIPQYRGQTNVIDRPSDIGISLTGHHEILLPLLRMAILVSLEERDGPTS